MLSQNFFHQRSWSTTFYLASCKFLGYRQKANGFFAKASCGWPSAQLLIKSFFPSETSNPALHNPYYSQHYSLLGFCQDKLLSSAYNFLVQCFPHSSKQTNKKERKQITTTKSKIKFSRTTTLFLYQLHFCSCNKLPQPKAT